MGTELSNVVDDIANGLKYGSLPTEKSLRTAIRALICWDKFSECLAKQVENTKFDPDIAVTVEADLKHKMYLEMSEIVNTMINAIEDVAKEKK